MRIYAAGWALQSPALNFFKRFLRANPSVSLSGIIYPKKIPEDIEGIPILDFDHARDIICSGDVVLDSHRPGIPNPSLHAAFSDFFAAQDIKTTSIADFLKHLVERDSANHLQLLLGEEVKSKDIRDLLATAPFSLTRDKFADVESFEVATKLDDIAKSLDWDRMLEFDKDETAENILFEVILNLRKLDVPARFRLLSTPGVFLNALLKLRAQFPEAVFSVEVAESLLGEFGPRLEFYRRSLSIDPVPGGDSTGVVLLAGEMAAITNAYEKNQKISPAVFFMRHSIFDYRKLQESLGAVEYRILLRQPNTSPESLIAALIV